MYVAWFNDHIMCRSSACIFEDKRELIEFLKHWCNLVIEYYHEALAAFEYIRIDETGQEIVFDIDKIYEQIDKYDIKQMDELLDNINSNLNNTHKVYCYYSKYNDLNNIYKDFVKDSETGEDDDLKEILKKYNRSEYEFIEAFNAKYYNI